MSKSLKKPIDEFLERCNEVHGNIYDYSEVSYNKLSDKIKIICNTHGLFEQRAFSHQQGFGCQKCSKSRGEKKIERFLIDNKIYFETDKKFESCKNKKQLPFDFFIPSLKICIEYDGIQHFEAVEMFGGQEKLKYQKKLDKIKDNWCIKNRINLLRIGYKDFNNIENILSNFLYKSKKLPI